MMKKNVELPAAEFFDDVSTDSSIAQNMERCRVCKILGSYSAATKQHDGIYATTDISASRNTSRHSHLITHAFIETVASVKRFSQAGQAFLKQHPKRLQQQQTLSQAMAPAINRMLFVEFFIECSLPFRCIELPSGKKMQVALGLTRDQLNRHSMRQAMLEYVKLNEALWLTTLKGKSVTLTIDIGTVFHRYVCFVVHCAGRVAVVYRLYSDTEVVDQAIAAEFGNNNTAAAAPPAVANDVDEDEHLLYENAAEADPMQNIYRKRRNELTIDNLAVVTTNVMNELSDNGVFVVAITTDNGSNLTGAADRCGAFSHRCACHGMQLVIKIAIAGLPLLAQTLDTVLAWVKVLAIDTTSSRRIALPVVTRWLCDLNMLEEVLKLHLDCRSRQEIAVGSTQLLPQITTLQIEQCVTLLTPFQIATRLCEGDDANLLQVIDALCIVGFGVSDDLCLGGSHPTRNLLQDMHLKIRDRMLTPALVIIAYFSPRVRVQQVGNDEFREVAETVLKWITTTQVADRMMKHINSRFPNASLTCAKMAALFSAHQLQWPAHSPNKNCTELTTSDIAAEFNHMSTHTAFWQLGRFLEMVLQIAASEASVERSFSRLKIVAPKRRYSMLPSTTSALLRASGFVKSEELRKLQAQTRQQQALQPQQQQQQQQVRTAAAVEVAAPIQQQQQQQQVRAEVAAPIQQQRHRDVLPTLTAIVKYAGEKLLELKQAANAAAAAGDVGGRRRKKEHVNAKCGCIKPNNLGTCKRSFRRADTVQDFKIICKQCKQWKCSVCVNNDRLYLGSGTLANYVCGKCSAYPRETWWDVGADEEEEEEDDDDEGNADDSE